MEDWYSPDATETQDRGLVDQVLEAAWSADNDVAALGELLDLLAQWATTVSDAWAEHGAVAQTAAFIENLNAQLASGANDQHQRLSANAVGCRIVRAGVRSLGSELLGLTHQHGDDWDEVCGCLAGTGLGGGHNITACEDHGDSGALDGSGHSVTHQVKCLHDNWVDAGLFELCMRLATVRGEVEETDPVNGAVDDIAGAVLLDFGHDRIDPRTAKTSFHSELACEEMFFKLGNLGSHVAIFVFPLVPSSLGGVDAAAHGHWGQDVLALASICGCLATSSVGAVVVWDRRGVAMLAGLALSLVLVLGSADVVLFWADLGGFGQGSFHLTSVEGGGGGNIVKRDLISIAKAGHRGVWKRDVSVIGVSEWGGEKVCVMRRGREAREGAK